jgi:glycosyltransferase involved in cell wall biosynthesis
VYGTEKWDLLAGTDLFIQPSRWEGLSAALAEAMAIGLPCAVSEAVASRVRSRTWTPGTPRHRDGATTSFRELGLVLEPTPAGAVDQIRSALAAPSLLAHWSRRSREHARSVFDPAAVAKTHLSLYEYVLGRPTAKPGTSRAVAS